MKYETSDKPVAIWLDDSMASNHWRITWEHTIQRIQEKTDNKFEIQLFGLPDDAIEFVLNNANRVFMYVQDSTRPDCGKIIPAWKTLRQKKTLPIGYQSHQGDFYTYVIDAFTPYAASIFAGFSFSTEAQNLIREWSQVDSRISLSDKMRLPGFLEEKGEFGEIGEFHLERWQSATLNDDLSSDIQTVKPLADELAVVCGVKPQLLDNLSPRQFEELIASIFRNNGFDVHLTASTRDGGYDIIAASHTNIEGETVLIEVKHFSPHRPVGVGIVRALYGVKCLHSANKAILATSSYVSQYARNEFSRVIPWELDFIERSSILDFCKRYVTDLIKDEQAENTEQGH